MITGIIVQHLRADAGVQACLGPRIWPLLIPQASSKPAAVVTAVIDLPTTTLCGPTRKRRAVMQIDVYALTTADAGGDTLAALAANAIESAMQTGDFAAVPQGRFEDYDDATQEFHVRMDFSVWRTQQ